MQSGPGKKPKSFTVQMERDGLDPSPIRCNMQQNLDLLWNTYTNLIWGHLSCKGNWNPADLHHYQTKVSVARVVTAWKIKWDKFWPLKTSEVQQNKLNPVCTEATAHGTCLCWQFILLYFIQGISSAFCFFPLCLYEQAVNLWKTLKIAEWNTQR